MLKTVLYAGHNYPIGGQLKGTRLTLLKSIKAKPGAGGGQLWQVKCDCGHISKKRASLLTGDRPITTCGRMKCPYFSARKSEIARDSNRGRAMKRKKIVPSDTRMYDVRVTRAGKNKAYDLWHKVMWMGWRSVVEELGLDISYVYQQIKNLEIGIHRVEMKAPPPKLKMSERERIVEKNVEYLTSIGIIRAADGRQQICPCCSWKSRP